jgi:aspartate/methionine/tyrosine aminotransferase
MFQVLARAQELERKGRKILHFEIGDPDFDTPQPVINAAIEALGSGQTHYTNSAGLLELREKAAEVTSRSRGFLPSVDQLLVTPGANFQIFLALSCIANPGDEILTPDPGFVSYEAIISYLGLKSRRYPVSEANDFEIKAQDIAKQISRNTKAIIINNPSNPTGGITSEGELRKIYKIAEDAGIFVLTDEIYARIMYLDESKYFSISSIDQCAERCVLINGLSKSYAMTGWRIGVITAPINLTKKMNLLLETLLSCVPGFIQAAAISALSLDPTVSRSMVMEYKYRRDTLVSGLNSIPGFTCKMPKGAFYAFPNVSKTGFSDIEISELLLEQCGIATVPGSYFGPNGASNIRFSYVCDVESIQEAIARLRNFFK